MNEYAATEKERTDHFKERTKLEVEETNAPVHMLRTTARRFLQCGNDVLSDNGEGASKAT